MVAVGGRDAGPAVPAPRSCPLITIEGVPTSADLLDKLRDEGRPVILNFSRGKDSVALWLELAARQISVVAIHKSIVPGLRFVREDLDRWEQHFGQHIIDLPSENFFRMLNSFVFQPPERCAIIEAADLPTMTREQWDVLMREHYAEPDTWILDGVRGSDSATRMMAMKRYGPVKAGKRRQSPIWDWTKREVMDRIARENLTLSREYEWYGRSIDGIRYDYLEPLRRHAPDDYQTVLDWFPLADLEIFRRKVVLDAV